VLVLLLAFDEGLGLDLLLLHLVLEDGLLLLLGVLFIRRDGRKPLLMHVFIFWRLLDGEGLISVDQDLRIPKDLLGIKVLLDLTDEGKSMSLFTVSVAKPVRFHGDALRGDSHLQAEVLGHLVDRDQINLVILEAMDQSSLLCLRKLIKEVRVFVILILVGELLPSGPPLEDPLIFLQPQEVGYDFLDFGFPLQ